MINLKCKFCGGALEIEDVNAKVVKCDYCDRTQTLPSLDNEKKLNLFARANRLRAANEFDKASGVYESIVAEFPEEAEAYWGLCLCKYGIEYVDDPVTGRKIPTCHRTAYESIFEDSDFEQACENADVVAQRVYREEAKEIDRIQKGILDIVSREEPFDIFICYKETAEDGQRTVDSVIAQDVYDALVAKGYKVFFSRITLEDKLGQEYEPYIFSALNSAKVMLAFGTNYEYFNAVWVKNEWSRFLAMMQKNKEKVLIPCYRDIDAYDMPQEFKNLQGQDMGKVGAIQDLVRGVGKIIRPEQAVVKETVSVSGNTNVAPLLKRAFMFLEDGEWEKADTYCENVLDQDPENAQAYIGKLMAELHIQRQENLADCKRPFDDNSNYKKAIRFGDENVKKALSVYIDHIYERKRMKEAKASMVASVLNERDLEITLSESKTKVADVDNKCSFDEAMYIYTSDPDVAAIVNRSREKTILFGRYIQNENGHFQPIEWQILAREHDRMLVISKYALDCQKYNTFSTDVTWETCSLRKWLNETFLNSAFSSEEQNLILSSTITAHEKWSDSTSPVLYNTTDKVFLLNIPEVDKYFNTEEEKRCVPTAYAKAKGADTEAGFCWWWLRYDKKTKNEVGAAVCYDGVPDIAFEINSDDFGVRPAMWIDLCE